MRLPPVFALLPLLCRGHARAPSSSPGQMSVGKLSLTLSADQTVAALGLSGTAGADGFSFAAAPGAGAELGDATFHARLAGAGAWASWASHGASPVPAGGCSALPCRAYLSFAKKAPFSVLREWERGPQGALRLAFKVTNRGTAPLEIGGVEIAMPFAWAAGSSAGDLASTFCDPAVTGEHGFATVTRLSGKREVLMITTGVDAARCKAGKPGCRTSLEAWDVYTGKAGGGSGGIGGIGSWLSHTKAFAAEWANASKPWLPATSLVLGAGEARDYVVLFSVAADVRSKDAALTQANTAVAHGVPGYILGTDMSSAALLVKPPAGVKLLSATTDTPAALKLGALSTTGDGGWVHVPVQAVADGRPRVTLRYSDDSEQVINYRTLPPFDQHMDTYGRFQADTAFFAAEDPFRRSPSFMPWDRELNAAVLDDPAPFAVGLSDDAGAGANAGFASKMRYRPTQHELEKLDLYINSTLWGKELDGAGVPVSLQDHSSHGIRSSMFWVPLPTTNETGEPGYNYPAKDFTGWMWDRARGDSLGRAYNYPHQTTSYWAMYHALRDNDKLTASQPWQWYLNQAAHTIAGMWQQARWYSQQGLMVGSVFKAILQDLIAEKHPLAKTVRDIMYNRTLVGVTYYSPGSCSQHGNTQCPCMNCTYGTGNTTTDCPAEPHSRKITKYTCISWAANPFPFGSEFAFDTTGQEEDYVWGRYFGTTSADRDGADSADGGGGGATRADALANLTLAAVLAYVPSTPHWAYNGAAWSVCDVNPCERLAGHYRTTLNAIPLLEEYYRNPDDLYLLAPAIGAASLHMATIDANGAASMGFHLSPKHLKLHRYSGDFGLGLFGHVQLAASVFVLHPIHGPQCYLCDATASATLGPNVTTIVPRDSIRRRVFIEPLGVLVEVMAGVLSSVSVATSARTFSLQLLDDGLASKFRVKVSTPSLNRPGKAAGVAPVGKPLPLVRGAFELPVTPSATVHFGLGRAADRTDANPAVESWELPAAAAPFSSVGTGCAMGVPAVLPDQAHAQMQLANAPDLPGFEGGFAAPSMLVCSQKCADQKSADGWHRLACQAWTFVEAAHSPVSGAAWCWLRAGRGNAVGRCGYTSATCDNRPAPATDWPCCANGFTCPDPMGPNATRAPQ